MCGGLEYTLRHEPKSPSFRTFCCKLYTIFFVKMCTTQNQIITVRVSVKHIYDNVESHFDENILWLHISVKDPTSLKEKDKGKKSIIIVHFNVNLFVIFS